MTTSTFEARINNYSWLFHVQQEIFQRDPHVFPQILKEKKHDDLSSKSKSLLRNTKSDKLYILGVRWIAHLATSGIR